MTTEKFEVGDIVVPNYEGIVATSKESGDYVKRELKRSDGQMIVVAEGRRHFYKCEYWRTEDTFYSDPYWDYMYFEADELIKVG